MSPVTNASSHRVALFYRATAILSLLLMAAVARAEDASGSWFERYQARVSATQAQQPGWITPLVTVTPRLEQEFRTDFVHSINSEGQTSWNYGNTKGLEFIPFRRIELIVNTPPFIVHNYNAKDGFGDLAYLAKLRLFARNEQHGNGIVTVFLAGSIPTGKNGNGSCCAIVTPTLATGKGFRQLALTSTAGGSLPVSNSHNLGHVISWNNTIQYRVGRTGAARLFWPEVEFNSSFYKGGANDGKAATFATPGIVVGRLPLTRNNLPGVRHPGLTVGIGEQIATTHYHPYNHALILTARIPF